MTGDVLLTCLALLAIVLTLGSVVGCLVLEGWQLNINESITLSVAVGMSVDFTAHLSHAYVRAGEAATGTRRSRVERVILAQTEMGVSVSTAALTTALAGTSMMFATVQLFYQFGMFLQLTMLFGWFYAVCFFGACCAIMGTEDGMWKKLFHYCTGGMFLGDQHHGPRPTDRANSSSRDPGDKMNISSTDNSDDTAGTNLAAIDMSSNDNI